jgi:tetratricopeptide (TPR) repeat protein
LTYEFTDRMPDHATVALMWEDLQVPIRISVDDMPGQYVTQMREELRDSPAFSWANWHLAAQYCLTNNINLDEALTWSVKSVEDPFFGSANFTTLTTLAQLQLATGKDADAAKTMDRALSMPELTPIQVHTFARQLQVQGKKEQAFHVFQANARKFPGAWPTSLGLARAYADKGDTKNALTWARKALANAPNEPNRKNVESFIAQLESPTAKN